MQSHDELKNYLLAKPETELDFPFGPDVSVFKVKKKMFALIGNHQGFLMLNLKCPPEESPILRDIFPAITQGYHMDKKHWISIYFDEARPVPDGEVLRLIDQSYMLIVQKLPKKDQTSIMLHLEQ